MRAICLAFLLAVPAAALAQPQARTVEVRLSNFDFAPREIHLRAGETIVLHLVNEAGGGHNFAAPEFFASAQGVSGPVASGRVELAGHGSADIRLTPAAGRYRLRCTHMLHTGFGMSGEIVVE